MQELEVYHGTKRENLDNILQNGFIESVSTSQKIHWLGRGIYFFEDLYYALEWNYCNIEKNNIDYNDILSETAIILARIDVENFKVLDLNSGLGYDAYKKMIDVIKQSCSNEELQELNSGKDIKIIRVIEKIEDKIGIELISSYDIVCALYPKNIFKKDIKKKGNFFAGLQKQICVKNQNAIIKSEEYDYQKENINALYNLILENRRNVVK